MKTPAAPEPGRTYSYFRQQVLQFLATARNANRSESELRRAVSAAFKNWQDQGYPKNWVVRARVDVLMALSPSPASRPLATALDNEPEIRE